jgi:hypothetical protein
LILALCLFARFGHPRVGYVIGCPVFGLNGHAAVRPNEQARPWSRSAGGHTFSAGRWFSPLLPPLTAFSLPWFSSAQKDHCDAVREPVCNLAHMFKRKAALDRGRR